MNKKIKEEKGALIVEASFVFPIMFLIIFLMLFMGNAFLQKSRVEAIVSRATIDGAAMCADPTMSYIKENGKVPPLKTVEIEPYRYIIGGMDDIELKIAQRITNEISNINTGLFSGMKPVNNSGVVTEYKSCFVASSFKSTVSYKIIFPMRLLGEKENVSLTFHCYCEVPVSDTPEFIRNVNMVEDVLESTGAIDKIKEMADSLKDFKTKK